VLVFLNSASSQEIQALLTHALVDGVTLNPSLLYQAGRADQLGLLRELLPLLDGPVFAQVTSVDSEQIVEEAHGLAAISPRVVVKLPSNQEGFIACRRLANAGVSVNMTLCFNPTQAVLAARMGARWVSPFLGRLDDAGRDGTATLEAICSALRHYDPEGKVRVLAASIRTPAHLTATIRAGAHAITLGPQQIRELASDLLSDAGHAKFQEDWRALIDSRAAESESSRESSRS
jgi:transaldolase